ncbi:sigma-70 family RNA polymerase sigma factor [Argonema antarcticum]|uniref:sigma-70 family RNA polymerase sigma factor n=1 Tax=Argonema antarcticum TaxID=2942763 RepID=UPI003B8460ED
MYLDAGVNVPESDRSDSYLAQQSIQGNQERFRQLYQRYHQRVRSTMYQLCGPSSLDDLVQEVFMRVWKGLPQLRQTSQFSTWLYRISWNVACDQRRKFAQQRTFDTKLKTENSEQSSAPDLMQLHYKDLVQRGLAQLSLDHRAVIVLHDLEEIPQKEMAEILGIPVGTVKSRLFHARAAMRQFLQSQGVHL